jgi:hypothetical protein
VTKPTQKKRERFYAEEAARSLGKNWDLGMDRECPDFVVSDGSQEFGLELTQIFVGPQDGNGSSKKAAEAKAEHKLDELRRQYEAVEHIPLNVDLVGTMDTENMASVIPALLAQDLPSKPVGFRFVHDTSIANPTHARLRVHVTKGLRPIWRSMNERSGFVDHHPHGIIASAIAKKAADLWRYQQVAGSDVRLMLVADRTSSSGKLTLLKDVGFEFCGFSAVYLFPYPASAVALIQRNVIKDSRDWQPNTKN